MGGTGVIEFVFESVIGQPGPGLFIEAEDGDGRSVQVGTWIDKGDGYSRLRIDLINRLELSPQTAFLVLREMNLGSEGTERLLDALERNGRGDISLIQIDDKDATIETLDEEQMRQAGWQRSAWEPKTLERDAIECVHHATQRAELAALRELAKLIPGAVHALRSYQCGNAAPDLAKTFADDLEQALGQANQARTLEP